MSLQKKIEDDVKAAMRAGNTVARDTLRMVLAAIKNRRIELGEELDDKQVLSVLSSCVKSRKDSVDQYEKAERADLAAKEKAEIEVIGVYLPRQLNEDETRAVVQRLIAELEITSPKEIGKLMKAVMKDYKGQIDGKMVQSVAGSILAE